MAAPSFGTRGTLRTRGALAAALGAALLIVVWLVAGRRDDAGTHHAKTTSAPAGEAAPGEGEKGNRLPSSGPVPGREEGAPASDMASGRGPEAMDDMARRAERVSQALEAMRFPPDSQPLRADMHDVLKPNRRHEAPMPLALAVANAGAKGDAPAAKAGELSFLLTGDVYTVIGRTPLNATLEVFRERDGKREPVAVDITGLGLSVVDASGGRPIPAPLLMNDDGRAGDARAGDRTYTARIVPAEVPALASHSGLVRLDVEFRAAEGDRRTARASLDFRVAGTVPAAVLGVSGERLTPDGLEVAVDLRVEQAGQYFVQGLLFDANDAPVGFAVARPRLAAGRASVPLVFFGLLFHEAKAAPGPFVFRTVTGYRLPEPGEADRADIVTWEGPYRTRAYAMSDFSEKEHESPSKELKLRALSELVARTARAPAE